MPRGEHAAPLMGARESISDSRKSSFTVSQAGSFAELGFCKKQRNAIRHTGQDSGGKKAALIIRLSL